MKMKSSVTTFANTFLIAATCPLLASASTFVDMGTRSGNDAHSACTGGSRLPVIRTQQELEDIQAFLGSTRTNFWLDAHMNPSCVGGPDGACSPSDVLWEDGGPPMDTSLYTGWLTMNIDGTRSCIMIWADWSGPKLDDNGCTSMERTICVTQGCDDPPSAAVHTSRNWNNAKSAGTTAHGLCWMRNDTANLSEVMEDVSASGTPNSCARLCYQNYFPYTATGLPAAKKFRCGWTRPRISVMFEQYRCNQECDGDSSVWCGAGSV